MEMMDCRQGCLVSLTGTASASPQNTSLGYAEATPKDLWSPVLLDGHTHKSWLCKYWASAQTETHLLPGFMCQKIWGLWFVQRAIMNRDSLSAIPYNPGMKDHFQNSWNTQCFFLGPTTKAEKKSAFLSTNIPSLMQTHVQEVMHPETTAAICASDSPNISSKIVEIPNFCQRGLGRNSINARIFTTYFLAEVN